MDLLKMFVELTKLYREDRDSQIYKDLREKLSEMLVPYGLTLYEHHDEYLWADVFIASIESPIDSL